MLRSAHPSAPAGSIAERWIERIFATYPPGSAEFLAGQRDRFANPVGHAIREAASVIVGALWHDTPGPAVDEALDRIVRIRSVQDLSPSEAVGFVFLLKDVLEETSTDGSGLSGPAGKRQLERRIDALALRAFDIFMGCREQLFEVRLHERDRWAAVALKRIEKQTHVARRPSPRDAGDEPHAEAPAKVQPGCAPAKAHPGQQEGTSARRSDPESRRGAGEEYGSRPEVGASSGMTPPPGK